MMHDELVLKVSAQQNIKIFLLFTTSINILNLNRLKFITTIRAQSTPNTNIKRAALTTEQSSLGLI